MEVVRLHLMLAHLPVAAVGFALLFLALGLVLRRNDFLRSAYLLLIVAVLLSLFAYWTGEGSEEVVEHALKLSEQSVEIHEDIAKVGLWSTIGVGVVAFFSLFFCWGDEWRWRGPLFVFFVSILVLTCLVWTASSGGKIRHTELYEKTSPKSGFLEFLNFEFDDD